MDFFYQWSCLVGFGLTVNDLDDYDLGLVLRQLRIKILCNHIAHHAALLADCDVDLGWFVGNSPHVVPEASEVRESSQDPVPLGVLLQVIDNPPVVLQAIQRGDHSHFRRGRHSYVLIGKSSSPAK